MTTHPTTEAMLDAAEQLAALARRMTVLAAAGYEAGLLPRPQSKVPERLQDHVAHHAAYLRRNPGAGPLAEAAMAVFQKAGKELARLETESDLGPPDAHSLSMLKQLLAELNAFPERFAAFPQLRELVTPKPPGQPEGAQTGPLAAAPAEASRPAARPGLRTGPLSRPGTGRLPAMAGTDGQALLDRGLARLRALEARLLVGRAADGLLGGASPAAHTLLAPAAREQAQVLAKSLAGSPAAIEGLRTLVNAHAAARKAFGRRPLPPEAADSLELLEAACGACTTEPKLAEWFALE